MTKKDRIQQLLANLELTNQDLLDLSDDIWLGIDHNDPDEFESGINFKRAYNEVMAEFTSVAERIQRLITGYTQVEADDGATPTDADQSEKDRIIRELDRTQGYGLDENFRYKRPFGYAFHGEAVKDLRTWRGLYERFCKTIAALHEDRFAEVTQVEEFITTHGNHHFSSDPETLRDPLEIVPNIWAEMHFSANNISDRIRELLDYFGYDWREFRVYLREDRDAAS